MSSRIQKKEVVKRIANRMAVDEKTAEAHLDATLDTLYEAFKAGESVTLPGFGGFYVSQSETPGHSSSIQVKNCGLCLGGLPPIPASYRKAAIFQKCSYMILSAFPANCRNSSNWPV